MSSLAPIDRAMSVGELVDRAVRLYRAHIGSLLLLAAVFLIPLGVVNGLISGEATTNSLQLLQQAVTSPGITPDELEGYSPEPYRVIAQYLMMPVAWIVQAIATLVIAVHVLAVLGGEDPGPAETLRRTADHALSFVGMKIFSGCGMLLSVALALVPTFVVLGAIGAVAGGVLRGSFEPDSDPASIMFSFALMMVFGLVMALVILIAPTYLATRWIVATPSLVEDRLGPIQALSRSWHLTRGSVWRSLGFLIVLTLLGYTVTMALGLALQVGAMFAPSAIRGPLVGAMAMVGQVLWLPVWTAALVMLYYDLRVRREGYDLALRVEKLASDLDESRERPDVTDNPDEAGWS